MHPHHQEPAPTPAERRGALLFALCCSMIGLLALSDDEQRVTPPRLDPPVARSVHTRTATPEDAPSAEAGPRAAPAGARVVPGELMLHLGPGVDVDAFAAEHGLEVRGRPRRAGPVLLGRTGADEGALLAQLGADPRVLSANRNGVSVGAQALSGGDDDGMELGGAVYERSVYVAPDDDGEGGPDAPAAAGSPDGPASPSLAYAGLQTHRQQVRAGGLLPGSATVGVAVIDSGVAVASPGCAPPLSIGGIAGDSGADLVDGDACALDLNQHGTHIASTIASYGNEVLGVAPGVRVISYRVLDADNRGSEWALVQALWDVAVDDRVDMVNMSLTFAPGFVPSDDLRWALDAVADAGKPMVAAAGNNGLPEVGWPAAHPAVIAVGSVCRTAAGGWVRAPYSNHGPQIDVMAPGGCLDRDVDGNGYVDGVLAATIGAKTPTQAGWWWMSGTSQAAAVVSGAGVVDVPGTVSQAWAAPTSGHAYTRPLYVAMLPLLQDMLDRTVRPRADLSVLDANGAPVAGVRVVGSFTGTTQAGFACVTDSQGRCTARGPAVAASATAAQAWTVQVGRVVDPAGFATPAQAVLFVDDDLQAMYAALQARGWGDALLAFEWFDRAAGGVRTKASTTLSNAGTGISTSPFGIILTPPALGGLGVVGGSSTVQVALSTLSGTGISTSPFGVRIVTLPAGGQLVALEGSGISTSPFGARSVLLPDTARCPACVVPSSLMTSLETGTVTGASATVQSWSVTDKLEGGGWINSVGAGAADVVASSLAAQSPVPVAASMPPVEHR